MGLSQFERRLERLVEGVFAKTMRAGLQPVELARRITREMDAQRAVGVRGTTVPNAFAVALAAEDADRFAAFGDALPAELADAAREHARAEGYQFVGPVHVELEVDPTLPPGAFLVAGRVEEGADGGPGGALVLPDGRRVVVGPEGARIGRLSDCDVVLDDPTVSKRHAEVRRDGAAFVLVDLGSTNGTRVNGAAVRERRLADGDRVSVGNSSLTFEVS